MKRGRMHRLVPLTLLTLLLWPGALIAPRPAQAAVACQPFPETGKTVCDPFLTYWRDHGGLAQQGLPLTDEFSEISPIDNKPYTVQYFERARFEKHPENAAPYDVLLGLVGVEQFTAKYPAPPQPYPGDPFSNPALPQECARFAETGKSACGPFLAYWRANGGLAQQGLPLTEIILEINPTNQRPYPTQYFERARFEYHLEHAGTPNAVLLGLLGREQSKVRYPNGVPGPATSPSPRPAPVGCGPLPPAFQGGQTYTDQRGRFTASYPRDWQARLEGAGNVSVVAASGAGIMLAVADAPGRQLDEYKDQIVQQVQAPPATNGFFQLLCLDKVTVGRYPAYRLRFLHNRVDTPDGRPTREEMDRIFFLANGRSYNANGFLEPGDAVRTTIEAVAASIIPGP